MEMTNLTEGWSILGIWAANSAIGVIIFRLLRECQLADDVCIAGKGFVEQGEVGDDIGDADESVGELKA